MTMLNLTTVLEQLVRDLVTQIPEFSHIDPDRLVVSIARSRQGSRQRILARIHPLRFAGGERNQVRSRGRQRYLLTMPRVCNREQEALYLVYFHVPRFFDLSFREKLVTVLHELYHISPSFDGDLRRFPGRNHAHGSSRKRYDQLMEQFADLYLQGKPELRELAILSLSHDELRQRHPLIVGRTFPPPRIAVTRLSS